MLYLASPYSHPDPIVVKTRVLLTMQCCAALIRAGHFVWSPILHSHAMAERESLPIDAGFWGNWSRDFIRRADGLYVLKIAGWEESKGVQAEVEFAALCQLELRMVDENGVVY